MSTHNAITGVRLCNDTFMDVEEFGEPQQAQQENVDISEEESSNQKNKKNVQKNFLRYVENHKITCWALISWVRLTRLAGRIFTIRSEVGIAKAPHISTPLHTSPHLPSSHVAGAGGARRGSQPAQLPAAA